MFGDFGRVQRWVQLGHQTSRDGVHRQSYMDRSKENNLWICADIRSRTILTNSMIIDRLLEHPLIGSSKHPSVRTISCWRSFLLWDFASKFLLYCWPFPQTWRSYSSNVSVLWSLLRDILKRVQSQTRFWSSEIFGEKLVEANFVKRKIPFLWFIV